MIYDARDCARLRLGVLLSSAVAWVAMVAVPERACHGSSSQPVSSRALAWLVMLTAMMAPVTLPALYHIRISTFVHRRSRSSALFLVGYGLVWTAAGGLLLAAEIMANRLMPGSFRPAIAVGLVAFVWQASPFKQRCLNRCRSHRSLAAFGVAADWDALRMGIEHGWWCAGSCWATMLSSMLLPAERVVGMAAVATLMLSERLDPPGPPAWRLRGFRTSWRWLQLRLLGPRGSLPPGTTRLPS
jgi:predicted metal-binding membrane protein